MIAVNWWATARGVELAYTLFDAKRIVWLPSSESRTTHLRITLAYLVAEVLGGPTPSLVKIGIASTFSLLRQIHVLKLRPTSSGPYSRYFTVAIIAVRSLALVGAFFILSKGNVWMYCMGTIALVSLVAWHQFLSKPPQKNAEELSAAVNDLRQKVITLSPSRVQQLETEIREGCNPATTPDEKVRKIFQDALTRFEDVRNVVKLQMDGANCRQRLRAQFKDRLEAFADPLDPKEINLQNGGFTLADIVELDRVRESAQAFKSCRGTCDQIEKEIADLKSDWETRVIFRRLHTLFSQTKFTDWPLDKLSPWLDKMQRTSKEQLFLTLNTRISSEITHLDSKKFVTIVLTRQQLVKIEAEAKRHFSINLNAFEEAAGSHLKAFVLNAQKEIEKNDDERPEFFQVYALTALYEARETYNAFPAEIQTSVERLKLEAAQRLERFLLLPVSLESLTRFCRELVKVWMIYDFLDLRPDLKPKLQQRFDLIDPQLVGKLSSQLKELQGNKQVRAAVAAISQNFSQFASIELSVAVDQLLDAAKMEELANVSQYHRKATECEQSATEDVTRAMYQGILVKVAKAQKVVDLHKAMKACIGRLELQFQVRLEASVNPLDLKEINLKEGWFAQADLGELDRVRKEARALDVCRDICDQIENEIAAFENRCQEEVIDSRLSQLFSTVKVSDWPAKGLSSFLKKMEQLNKARYQHLQSLFVSRLTGIITTTNATDFQQIALNYRDISKMKRAVDGHFDIDLGSFVATANTCLDTLALGAGKEVDNHDSTRRDFFQLDRLDAFCQASQELAEISPQKISQSKEKLKGKADEYLTAFKKSIDSESYEEISKMLIKLWRIFDLLGLVKDLEAVLKALFVIKGDDWLHALGGQLNILLVHPDDSVRSAALAITETFSEFESIRIERATKLAQGVTFGKALAGLESEPVLTPEHRQVLEELGAAFNKSYQTHLKSIADGKFEEKRNIASAKALAEKVKGHFQQGMVAAILQRISAIPVHQKKMNLVELVSCIFAQWTFIHSLKRPDGTREGLMRPHQTQLLAIFQLLGLYKDEWNLTHHICEVRTGEGKSITFGVCSILFALLGHSVKVACFSKYLSERDQASFQKLFASFGIENNNNGVMYLSIRELGAIVYESQYKGMYDSIFNFLRGSNHTKPERVKKDKSILLIDEIDVLLHDSFFGACLGRSRVLHSESVTKLLRHIWERREELQEKSDDAQTINQIFQSEFGKAVLNDFPQLAAFIKDEISKMIRHLKLAEKYVKERRYIVRDTLIYYPDPGGNPIHTGNAYSLAFAYLHFEHSKNDPVDNAALNEHLCIPVVFSRLRYNSFLSHFSVCLGITGTLRHLSEEEKGLLRYLGFKETSVVPTTYPKQQLVEDLIVVQGGGREPYHKAIRDRCERVCQDNRACLIIFENEADLNLYRTFVSSPTIEILVGNSDDKEKTRVVSQAIRQRGVTLMTAAYGRGTDFYCHDQAINTRGGVHVIVTFFPDSKSEEFQFKGRTCRQNNMGSFGYILWDENLLKKDYVKGKTNELDGTTFPDIDRYIDPDPPWYERLDKIREEKLKVRVKELMLKDEKNKSLDRATEKLVDILGADARDDDRVLDVLTKIHYEIIE